MARSRYPNLTESATLEMMPAVNPDGWREALILALGALGLVLVSLLVAVS